MNHNNQGHNSNEQIEGATADNNYMMYGTTNTDKNIADSAGNLG